jgi:hypothetical protein
VVLCGTMGSCADHGEDDLPTVLGRVSTPTVAERADEEQAAACLGVGCRLLLGLGHAAAAVPDLDLDAAQPIGEPQPDRRHPDLSGGLMGMAHSVGDDLGNDELSRPGDLRVAPLGDDVPGVLSRGWHSVGPRVQVQRRVSPDRLGGGERSTGLARPWPPWC